MKILIYIIGTIIALIGSYYLVAYGLAAAIFGVG